MLVLSRKTNEEIIIGGKIRVTVVEITGNRVKLGVSAPIEVPVHRAEVASKLATEAIEDTLTGSCCNSWDVCGSP